MKSNPNTEDHPDGTRGPSPNLFAHHTKLADIPCERRDGRPCQIDLLGHAGLPVPEGVILGREAHREFMEQSGLVEDLLAHGRGEDLALRIRLAHHSNPIKGELNRELCDALIELGAPSVTVASEGFTRRGLQSIPEVKDAVRDAWLSLEGLRRQIEAAARGEQIPAWPVSIFAE